MAGSYSRLESHSRWQANGGKHDWSKLGSPTSLRSNWPLGFLSYVHCQRPECCRLQAVPNINCMPPKRQSFMSQYLWTTLGWPTGKVRSRHPARFGLGRVEEEPEMGTRRQEKPYGCIVSSWSVGPACHRPNQTRANTQFMIAHVKKQWCVKRAHSLTSLKQPWKPSFPRSLTHIT